KEKGKEKETGPSGNVKGKAREVPATPKKTTPKKSQPKNQLESEDEEVEAEKQQCIYCVKKNITCVPQVRKKVCIACGRHKMKCKYFDKTAWAVMDGSQKVADAVRELVEMEKCKEAGCLEVVWHDLGLGVRVRVSNPITIAGRSRMVQSGNGFGVAGSNIEIWNTGLSNNLIGAQILLSQFLGWSSRSEMLGFDEDFVTYLEWRWSRTAAIRWSLVASLRFKHIGFEVLMKFIKICCKFAGPRRREILLGINSDVRVISLVSKKWGKTGCLTRSIVVSKFCKRK
ncbi:hypothetical protein M422DRAFT_263546, partial [Sphaerobolus stellatus SS14]